VKGAKDLLDKASAGSISRRRAPQKRVAGSAVADATSVERLTSRPGSRATVSAKAFPRGVVGAAFRTEICERRPAITNRVRRQRTSRILCDIDAADTLGCILGWAAWGPEGHLRDEAIGLDAVIRVTVRRELEISSEHPFPIRQATRPTNDGCSIVIHPSDMAAPTAS
jgi:hypothetical protein